MSNSNSQVRISTSKIRHAGLYFFAAAGVVMLAYGGFGALVGGRALAQQDPFLSRRVDQMEQRFYTIESRLNSLESATRPTLSSPRPTAGNDAEVQSLRQQVDGLRVRLGEAECGLLRLDERTLTPAARAARAKASLNPDPCRRDPMAPVSLSARPY